MILEDFHLFHISKELNSRLKGKVFYSIKTSKKVLLLETQQESLLFMVIDNFSIILLLDKSEKKKLISKLKINFSEHGKLLPPAKILEIIKIEDERKIDLKIRDREGEKFLELSFIPHNIYFKIENFPPSKGQERRISPEKASIDFALPKEKLKREILKNVKFTSPSIIDFFLKNENLTKEKLMESIEIFYKSKTFYLYETSSLILPILDKREKPTKEDNSILKLLHEYLKQYLLVKEIRELKKGALREIDNKIKHHQRMVYSLQREIEPEEKIKRYKLFADLISSNLYKLEKSKKVKEIELEDFSGKKIKIPLNPAKDLIENRDLFYKLYSKKLKALRENPQKISEIKDKLDKLLEMREKIEEAKSLKALNSIFEELGIKSQKDLSTTAKKGKKEIKGEKFKRFHTSDGYLVLVGKNARENDILTFKYASPDDLWFHVADYGGSHTILVKKSKKKNPPFSSIVEAAQIAAYFSKAPKGDYIDVRWTERKHVLKIKGTPGLVRLRKFNTINVVGKLPEKN